MENFEIFEDARKLFPGKVKGHEREWANFERRSKKPVPGNIKFDIDLVMPLLIPAIEYQIRYRQWCKDNNNWCACWKNFQTWINGGWWEEEFSDFDAYEAKEKKQFVTAEDSARIRQAKADLLKGERHVKDSSY